MAECITVWDVAKARGVVEMNGSVPMSEFKRVGLPMFGGCQVCSASIAAGNACPGRNGYLLCTDCATEETAFTDLEECVDALFGEEN